MIGVCIFQYQQSKTKSSQGVAALPFASNQQRSVYETQQSFSQHAAHCRAEDRMGVNNSF